MFFLPHNLWCLCRKGDNPVWSHQSVQLVTMKWKLKMEEVVCVGRGAYIPSLDFSTIPLSCQSYWSALLFTFHSTHGLLIKSIRLSNFRQIRWDEKALCPCGSSDCEDLHCWFILEKPSRLALKKWSQWCLIDRRKWNYSLKYFSDTAVTCVEK